MRLLVTGPNDYADWNQLRNELMKLGGVDTVLVTTGRPGVESMARYIWSHDWGFETETYKPDWETLGKAAGYRNNDKVVAMGVDAVLQLTIEGKSDALSNDLTSKARMRAKHVHIVIAKPTVEELNDPKRNQPAAELDTPLIGQLPPW